MGLLPPFQLPRPYAGDLPHKAKAGHTTIKGRVVYNRARHFFTTKDVRRIINYLLTHDAGVSTNYLDFLAEWGELELMLLELLASRGGVFGSSPLFELIKFLVGELIAGKTEPPPPIIKEK